MKNRYVTFILIILPTVSVYGNTLLQNPPYKAVIDQSILAHAKKERGEEYQEARQVITGDINNDGKEDVVVQYTLEGFRGGNNYIFYIAVFINNNGQYSFATRVIAGGKGSRNSTIKEIKEGKIYCEIKESGPNDAVCCPSKAGTTEYILKPSKRRYTLIEINKKIKP